jgi:CheY-like chemotaxis protein
MENVYALTPQGQAELQGGMTTVPPAQLELLVRFDGQLTLAQIKAAMPAMPLDAFRATVQALCDRHLAAPVETDLFQLQLQAQLDRSRVSGDAAQADAGMVSLRRTGYYVEIARERAAAPARPPGQALTVVVIEDEPVLARFIQTYLSLEGIQARLAGNRAEVSAALSTRPVPDLVLLDVMLPDADGFDILARLRQHPVLRSVPVLMLTGKATRESVIRGLAAGADGYLTKPFQAESLMRAARTCLGLAATGAGAGADPWSNADAKALKWQLKAA